MTFDPIAVTFQLINIRFEFFELEECDFFVWDFVEVYDGNSTGARRVRVFDIIFEFYDVIRRLLCTSAAAYILLLTKCKQNPIPNSR